MAAMARDFNSVLIKNTGDSLIYYFPETSDSANMSAFKRVLECGLTMIAVHPIINTKLNEEGLPSLDYRISADYGRADIAQFINNYKWRLIWSYDEYLRKNKFHRDAE